MEFKRCERCGDFFSSSNKICNNCFGKDNSDISQLKDFFAIHEETNFSITDISLGTGISTKNITRFLQNNQFIENQQEIFNLGNSNLK